MPKVKIVRIGVPGPTGAGATSSQFVRDTIKDNGANDQVLNVIAGALAWQYPSRKAVNIRNKGAVSGSDIRTPLRDAIADAALYNQPVYVPTGDWRISAPGTYQAGATATAANFRLVGDGPGSSIRMAAGTPTGTRMLVLSAARFVVEGIHLDLSDAGTGALVADGTGLFLQNTTGGHIGHVSSANPASGGIHVHDGVFALSVDHYEARGEGYGILTHDVLSGGDWSFTNLWFDGQNKGGDGIEINCPTTGVSDVHVLHVQAKNYNSPGANAGFGVALANIHNFIIDDIRGRNCSRNLVHIEDNSSDGVVSNIVARGCGHGGVEVQAGTATTARGCENLDIHHANVSGCNTLAPLTGSVGEGAIDIARNNYQQHINVRHCTVYSNGQNGINVWLTNDSHIEHNQVWSNAKRGIYAVDMVDGAIRDNTTYGNTTAGIETIGTGAGSLVADNYARDATKYIHGFSPVAVMRDNR